MHYDWKETGHWRKHAVKLLHSTVSTRIVLSTAEAKNLSFYEFPRRLMSVDVNYKPREKENPGRFSLGSYRVFGMNRSPTVVQQWGRHCKLTLATMQSTQVIHSEQTIHLP